jgi:hypothetical protein
MVEAKDQSHIESFGMNEAGESQQEDIGVKERGLGEAGESREGAKNDIIYVRIVYQNLLRPRAHKIGYTSTREGIS